MATIIKGVKLRLYPNNHQRDQLWQMFGNDRKVWNLMLGMAQARYQNNPSSSFVNEYGMNYLLKRLKQEYPYLKESDATSFLVVNHNLALAFKMLFKHRGGYPRFKSRHATKLSYTGRSTCKVIAKRRMFLPKLGSIRTSKTVGLDVGIASLAISSDGVKYATFNAKWLEKEANAWQSKYSKRKHRATIAMRQWNHNHSDFKMVLNSWQKN